MIALDYVIKLFRLKHWWNYIVPPVLSAVYFVLIFSEINFLESIFYVLLSFLTIISTAAFGFFLNDWTDIESDRISNKSNLVAQLSKRTRWTIIVFLLIIAIIPWIFIYNSLISLMLFSTQLILLTGYSVPPLRLKKHLYIAIICDSLYSGLIFMLAIIYSKSIIKNQLHFENLLLFVFIVLFILRGIRNILIHQMLDAKNDISANILTIANKYGSNFCLRIIKQFFVMVEIVMIFCFTLILSFSLRYFWLIIPIFIVYFSLKIFDKKLIQGNFILKIQILNDFYEDFIPLSFLIFLTINNISFLFLMILHIISFRNKIIWLFVQKILYGYVYRKIIIWFYYKGLCNKYAKRAYFYLGFKPKD